jgi:serine/threonine protein kinase
MTIPNQIKTALIKLNNNYYISDHITEGENGYVFKAINRVLESPAIIKFYNWDGDPRFHLEPQALTRIDSPNVLKVLDAGVVDCSWAYFITPFCSEGSLDALLASDALGTIQAFEICNGILNGLTYLHASRFIHRDLKPGNIYIHLGRPVIGDFGSLIYLRCGETVVPASRHSVLYRPPESVTHDHYCFAGDIYQVGVILYQLLGGSLPYEEKKWLTDAQLKIYNCKKYPDNTIFADECLKARIARGRLLDLNTIHAWAPHKLRRLVKKACNKDPTKRFESAGAFLAALSQTRAALADWAMVDGYLTLRASPTSYRILTVAPPFRVEKRRQSNWRKDSTCSSINDLRSLVLEIEGRC